MSSLRCETSFQSNNLYRQLIMEIKGVCQYLSLREELAKLLWTFDDKIGTRFE